VQDRKTMTKMMRSSSGSSPWLYTTLPLSISAVIHLLPLPGLLGTPALERLYGIRITTKNAIVTSASNTNDTSSNASLLLTLQHRAAMFGTIGIGLFLGTFVHRQSLPAAMGMVFMSDVSFLALALPRWKRLNAKMKTVVYADVISIVCLIVGSQQVL
jgi:hypothetical protein